MSTIQVDALLPADIAKRAEDTGVAKANLSWGTTLALSVLGGAFIALGAMFATTVSAGAGALPYGVARLLAGLVFSLGLILVVVAGAELFTGNALIVMACAARRLTLWRLLRNWTIVFAGNFVGAVSTAVLVFASGQYLFGDGAVGRTALDIARGKLTFGFMQAVALGMLCNALVCLAVWLSLSARSTSDRILSVVFPVTAFVASGFEHSVANMYYLPVAQLITRLAPPEAWVVLKTSPEQYAGITWKAFLAENLLPVTLGNVIGGALMVGAVYWFIYRREARGARVVKSSDRAGGNAQGGAPVGRVGVRVPSPRRLASARVGRMRPE